MAAAMLLISRSARVLANHSRVDVRRKYVESVGLGFSHVPNVPKPSLVRLCFGMLGRFFRGRRSLLLENLALRQQLVALKRRHPRPSLGLFDKLFWVIARRVWPAWKHFLILVTPETVVRWHRTGFRMYWRLISRVRRQVGRRPDCCAE
jgi:hypothetical protein